MSYQCLSNLQARSSIDLPFTAFETELLDAGGLSFWQTATVDGRDRSVVLGALQEKHQTGKAGSSWLTLEAKGTKDMPKQSPIPNAVDKPFYDACNEERLVVQYCANCRRHQFPPRPSCSRCGNDAVEWRQVSGRGRIISRVVVHDTPTSSLIPGQPFNVAAIALDEEPEVIMLSHLPGTPVDQVPIGAAVEVIFETTPATGQKVPEWRVIG
jgi:uncharacterized protein